MCVAVYLPTGIDVRLMEGDHFRRTRLARDAREADTVSDEWLAALIGRGWQASADQSANRGQP